jgi:hypothetical protein
VDIVIDKLDKHSFIIIIIIFSTGTLHTGSYVNGIGIVATRAACGKH